VSRQRTVGPADAPCEDYSDFFEEVEGNRALNVFTQLLFPLPESLKKTAGQADASGPCRPSAVPCHAPEPPKRAVGQLDISGPCRPPVGAPSPALSMPPPPPSP
jgi:hypothetical protein